jgi:hypothetical protein
LAPLVFAAATLASDPNLSDFVISGAKRTLLRQKLILLLRQRRDAGRNRFGRRVALRYRRRRCAGGEQEEPGKDGDWREAHKAAGRVALGLDEGTAYMHNDKRYINPSLAIATTSIKRLPASRRHL